MELERIRAELDRLGIAVFAISYDSVEVLRDFSAEHGISYALLSDEASVVIGALGLLNARLQDRAVEIDLPFRERYVGVSYPAVFLLDPDGRVAERRSYQDDHVRDSGTGLLEDLLGLPSPSAGPSVVTAADAVRVRSYLDSSTYARFQRLQLVIELDVERGYHVYADPAPVGCSALGVEIDELAGVAVSATRWPEAQEATSPAGERYRFHAGRVRSLTALTFGPRLAGDLAIAGRVSFQACDRETCLVPSRVGFRLTLTQRSLV